VSQRAVIAFGFQAAVFKFAHAAAGARIIPAELLGQFFMPVDHLQATLYAGLRWVPTAALAHRFKSGSLLDMFFYSSSHTSAHLMRTSSGRSNVKILPACQLSGLMARIGLGKGLSDQVEARSII
jgi:hypothetical protein